MHEQEQVSTTDPDSTYATKGGTPARLGYYDNYLVDNQSCVIVGVQATAARMSQETVAAQDMITRFAEWQGREPESVAADTTYGNGEFLQWLMDRGHHSVHAYPRQCSSARTAHSTVPSVSLTNLKTTLPLSRRPATQLRRPQCSEPNPRLHRDAQTMWRVRAKSAMHQRLSAEVFSHPCSRVSPATCAGVNQYTRVCSMRSEREKRWKPCSPNSRIKSDCVVCVCGD